MIISSKAQLKLSFVLKGMLVMAFALIALVVAWEPVTSAWTCTPTTDIINGQVVNVYRCKTGESWQDKYTYSVYKLGNPCGIPRGSTAVWKADVWCKYHTEYWAMVRRIPENPYRTYSTTHTDSCWQKPWYFAGCGYP